MPVCERTEFPVRLYGGALSLRAGRWYDGPCMTAQATTPAATLSPPDACGVYSITRFFFFFFFELK
jgi:hypothetical protein